MGYYIGRFLQGLGLIIVPIGVMVSIYVESLKPEVYYLVAGGLCFFIGWWMVHAFGRKS